MSRFTSTWRRSWLQNREQRRLEAPANQKTSLNRAGKAEISLSADRMTHTALQEACTHAEQEVCSNQQVL